MATTSCRLSSSRQMKGVRLGTPGGAEKPLTPPVTPVTPSDAITGITPRVRPGTSRCKQGRVLQVWPGYKHAFAGIRKDERCALTRRGTARWQGPPLAGGCKPTAVAAAARQQVRPGSVPCTSRPGGGRRAPGWPWPLA